MLTSIHFDDEPRFFAEEIRDVRPDRYLPAKLPPVKSAAPEEIPEPALCMRHGFSKVAGGARAILRAQAGEAGTGRHGDKTRTPRLPMTDPRER